LLLTFFLATLARGDILSHAKALEQKGQLKQAQTILADYLSSHPDLSEPERRQVVHAIERLRRLPVDYNLSRAQVLQQLKESIAEFSDADFVKWKKEGRFDFILIEGEERYHYATCSNLFTVYPDIYARRLHPPDTESFERNLLAYCRRVNDIGSRSLDRFILPQKWHARMTVSLKKDVVLAGEIVRCWLPYPRSFPFQSEIHFVQSDPPLAFLDQPLSPIRSAYMERTARSGEPITFTIEYDFTTFATIIHVDPQKVVSYKDGDFEYREFTREQPPHIVFTPQLRDLSRKIVGEEKNPYLIARKIYDWIAQNIHYAYMIEYSLIDNLSMYAITHSCGDCGVEAMLFIALCRLNGIPARWQSGWMFGLEGKTIHDWAEFYVEPYGWLPCDPYRGIWAEQMTHSLSQDEKQFLKDFFFGNLTAFRMAANADHDALLYPPKRTFRSDDVDFQRGELEWGEHNIYFDERDYEWQVVPK